MNIFLSWSGEKSKATAEVLKIWIKKVIQATNPWISSDISKGIRWNEEVGNRLEESKLGIICLTKENLKSEWILFETGAISKTKDAYVWTFLLDIKPADVEAPLAQFQHTIFDKVDIRKLIFTINNILGDCALEDKLLEDIYETNWPELYNKLQNILKTKGSQTDNNPSNNVGKIRREDREILEEILENTRQTLNLSKVSMSDLSQIKQRELEKKVAESSEIGPFYIVKQDKQINFVTDLNRNILQFLSSPYEDKIISSNNQADAIRHTVKEILNRAYIAYPRIRIFVIALNEDGYNNLPEKIAVDIRLLASESNDITTIINDSIGVGIYFGEDGLSSAVIIDTTEEEDYDLLNLEIELASTLFISISTSISWAL